MSRDADLSFKDLERCIKNNMAPEDLINNFNELKRIEEVSNPESNIYKKIRRFNNNENPKKNSKKYEIVEEWKKLRYDKGYISFVNSDHNCLYNECQKNNNIYQHKKYKNFFVCWISGIVHECGNENELCRYTINTETSQICYISGFEIGTISKGENQWKDKKGENRTSDSGVQNYEGSDIINSKNRSKFSCYEFDSSRKKRKISSVFNMGEEEIGVSVNNLKKKSINSRNNLKNSRNFIDKIIPNTEKNEENHKEYDLNNNNLYPQGEKKNANVFSESSRYRKYNENIEVLIKRKLEGIINVFRDSPSIFCIKKNEEDEERKFENFFNRKSVEFMLKKIKMKQTIYAFELSRIYEDCLEIVCRKNQQKIIDNGRDEKKNIKFNYEKRKKEIQNKKFITDHILKCSELVLSFQLESKNHLTIDNFFIGLLFLLRDYEKNMKEEADKKWLINKIPDKNDIHTELAKKSIGVTMNFNTESYKIGKISKNLKEVKSILNSLKDRTGAIEKINELLDYFIKNYNRECLFKNILIK